MSYERKISPGFTFKDFRNCETKRSETCGSLHVRMSCSIPEKVQMIKFSRTFAVTGMKLDKICAENHLFSEGLTIFPPKVN